MVSALLLVSSFFAAIPNIAFGDSQPYTCSGGMPYNEAPIKWYFNKTSRFCLAVRGGCQTESQNVLTMYGSIEDCIENEFQDGYNKQGRGSCFGEYFGKTPITYVYGSKKTKAPYLMSACYAEERMCPEGSGCFYDKASALATCCSVTKIGNSDNH